MTTPAHRRPLVAQDRRSRSLSHATVNWRFTDTRASLASTLDDAALTYAVGKLAGAAILEQRTLADALQRGEMTVTGSASRLTKLMALLDDFDAGLAIVEPRPR